MTRLISLKMIPTVLLGALLLLTSAAIAAAGAADPVIGTWKLNVAKSKFIHGPALKAGTRTYEETTDGMLRVTLKSVGTDGKESTLVRTFKQDGKEYPINDSSGADSISETRINARMAKYAEKKAGEAIVTGHRILSKDGKTLTVMEKGTDATGSKFEYRLVYDKE